MESTREFVIRGDTVQLVDRKVVRSVTVKSFLDQLKKDALSNLSLSSGLLPPGTLLCCAGHGLKAFVFQTVPGMRAMKYQAKRQDEHRPTEYAVSMPWLQWYVVINTTTKTLQRVAVTGSVNHISSPDDLVYRAPLPNVHPDNLEMCTGAVIWPNRLPDFKALPEFVDSMWSTVWNDDLDQPWEEYGLTDRASTDARFEQDTRHIAEIMDAMSSGPVNAETWLANLATIGPEVRSEPVRGIPVLAKLSKADPDTGLKIIAKAETHYKFGEFVESFVSEVQLRAGIRPLEAGDAGTTF
jgi:hypothetical protein